MRKKFPKGMKATPCPISGRPVLVEMEKEYFYGFGYPNYQPMEPMSVWVMNTGPGAPDTPKNWFIV